MFEYNGTYSYANEFAQKSELIPVLKYFFTNQGVKGE